MGTLVFAGTTSHVSGIIRTPDADPERSPRLTDAWLKMSADLAAADPDIVLVIGTDHQETYGLENYPPFAIGQAERYEPWNEHGIPGSPVAGDYAMSGALHASLIDLGFDISVSMDMPLDHSFLVPIQRLGIEQRRIVPFFINCNQLPLPTLRRCHDLGRALRRAIEALPDGTRVALIGTGGVSHWVAIPREGEINESWDRDFLAKVTSGDLEAVLALSDDDIVNQAGNGALEIRTWIAAAAAAGTAGGELLAYEPMYPWVTGIGIVELAVA